jgi:hypothetical protein
MSKDFERMLSTEDVPYDKDLVQDNFKVFKEYMLRCGQDDTVK